ncbi:hypothetical protein ABLB96_08930 [Acinetobacter sp. XH1741]|uniref:hypothetical protein n=1 Tax=unclassified Acinetobacter TaxID=196816 RepID=UPI0032B407C9
MTREYKYYQVESTHYNLEQVVKFTTSTDLRSALVRFSDGSEEEFTFANEDEYLEFLQVIRGIEF